MPRIIVERKDTPQLQAGTRERSEVRLVRTFSLGGRTFDVYVAAKREALLGSAVPRPAHDHAAVSRLARRGQASA